MHTASLNNYTSDRSLLLISVVVLAAHLAAFFVSAFMPQTVPVQPKARRLVVQTVTLKPAPVTTVEPKRKEPRVAEPEPVLPAPPSEQPVHKAQVEEEPTPIPEPTPAPEPALQPQTKPKTPAKPTPAKKTKPSPKPTKKPPQSSTKKKEVPKKSAPKQAPKADAAKAKRRELLANAQKKIAQVDQARSKVSETKPVRSAPVLGRIDNLQVDTFVDQSAALSPLEISYYDELASRLKLQLRLPEFGEVKIKLTLGNAGDFVSVAFVHAESKKNRAYIEKMVPTLKYPSFGTNFKGLKQYTFVLALRG